MLIERLERSPHRRTQPAALDQVRLHDGVVQERVETNARTSLLHGYRMLEEWGNFEAFDIAAGRRSGTARGYIFRDENIYKWLEGAVLALAAEPNAELAAAVERSIELIVSTQQPDGYLNTGYTCGGLERWTDLAMGHEIYCTGTLIEAGIAHRRATGRDTLFNAARKAADLLCDTFGAGKRAGACGHPCAEVALVELYRETGERRYLDLARFFIDIRGAQPPVCGGRPYMQDHLPFREQHEAVGHVVRGLYLYGGAADVHLETGEAALLETLDALWRDIDAGKTYLTGGLGPRYHEEDFGDAYELPNARAYCETCGTIAHMRWNKRMFAIRPDARYIDAIETSLYNAFFAGTARDGASFFYMNPLESRGRFQRTPWHKCACCPPNVMRTMAQLPSYLFSVGPRELYVNLYHASEFHGKRLDGAPVALRVETDYPWDGDVRIAVDDAPADLVLALRIPGWCEQATATVNGKPVREPITAGTFLRLERPWHAGDVVELHMAMPPRIVACHPYASNNRGQAALCRGPLVYCFESPDQPSVDLTCAKLRLDAAAPAGDVKVGRDERLLDGAVTLTVPGIVEPGPAADQPTFTPLRRGPAAGQPAELRAIPYALWANRGQSTMFVWLPVEWRGATR